MHISEFDYDLPPHLIAQEACAERDQSRLLVIRRKDATLAHHVFRDLPELLAPGDLLVLNDTRVLPARLLGRRARTGGKWEGLFVRAHPGGWELMCQGRGRLQEGEIIEIEPGPLRLRLLARIPKRHWLAEPSEPGDPAELLARHGQVPLPPYIRKGRAVEADRERYQTIYARQAGAVAAPTAGLHFTPEVFERLRVRDIDVAYVTLHVGPGTFQPIQVEDVTAHRMHTECGELSEATARAVAECRARGGRVLAVGTTSVRLLETVGESGEVQPWSGATNRFIYPGYRFRVVDGLVTNFHLPRSTLLLLVSAFAGVELIRRAYKTAVDEGYRFYSYGDAMLIV
jgi:S-adenosylmethionine:tRNA ribosyltransferase-isomerase